MKQKLALLSCAAVVGFFTASPACASCCQCETLDGTPLGCSSPSTVQNCLEGCEQPNMRCYYSDDDGPGCICNDNTDVCEGCEPAPALVCESRAVPAVSEWGLIILAVAGLTAGTVVISRRRASTG